MSGQLLQLLSARWLIYRGEILSYLPLFYSFMNGNQSVLNFADDIARNKPYVISGTNVVSSNQYDLTDNNIPENSVAIIPIMGVMVSWKTQELANNVLKAQENPNISSILFMVNSPGGMVFYTDIAAQIIKDCPKPTVALVMNMACSAAMWLVSACDQILLSSKLDVMGSIGVMLTFTDFNGFLKEKLGITVYDIYARKSEEKNHDLRQLLAGNEDPILDELDFTNQIFHNAIIENLGISADSEVFKGGHYNAQKAIDLGLAHGFSSFPQAIETAYKLGLKQTISSLMNNL
ncbi:MAG: S49 family peptidase [Bacteroidales bacterium]